MTAMAYSGAATIPAINLTRIATRIAECFVGHGGHDDLSSCARSPWWQKSAMAAMMVSSAQAKMRPVTSWPTVRLSGLPQRDVAARPTGSPCG